MSMPYHNLHKAHHRLVSGLTDNTLYLTTIRKSMWDALRRIWLEADAAARERNSELRQKDAVKQQSVQTDAGMPHGLAEK
jgi:hypothetical protein